MQPSEHIFETKVDPSSADADPNQRIKQLEDTVAELRAQLATLTKKTIP